jgi:uncharacterized protein (DUF488 family)
MPQGECADPPPGSPAGLWTIGYQESTLAAVLAALHAESVELLIDVRAVPASRRPGFSKRQLAAGLAEAGIRYLHLRALGTPAEGRLAARQGRHARLREIYAAHLATTEAQAELAELAGLVAAGRRVCLLCLERDPAHCHRSLIADALVRALGVEPCHLLP